MAALDAVQYLKPKRDIVVRNSKNLPSFFNILNSYDQLLLLSLKDGSMKKTLLFAATLIIIATVASPASALFFDVRGDDFGLTPRSSVDINVIKSWGTADPPKVTLNDKLDKITFHLDPGDSSDSFRFFDVELDSAEDEWGLGKAEISATLAFDAPKDTSGTGGSKGWWITYKGLFSGGVLHWNQQPEDVHLTPPVDGIGSFSIKFSDKLEFGEGNTASVYATVTANGVAPVPEPGTIVLMGIGLVGLARVGRRKIKR